MDIINKIKILVTVTLIHIHSINNQINIRIMDLIHLIQITQIKALTKVFITLIRVRIINSLIHKIKWDNIKINTPIIVILIK